MSKEYFPLDQEKIKECSATIRVYMQEREKMVVELNNLVKRDNIITEQIAALEQRIEKAIRVLTMGHTEREREAWRILKGEGDGTEDTNH